MRRSLRLMLVVCLLFDVLASRGWTAQDAPAASALPPATGDAATKFLRVQRDERQQAVALETAVTRYASPAGQARPVTVDLIAAVHVGDPAYYRQLNQLFQGYEVVLYELVAPEGTRVVPGEARANQHPVTLAQTVLKNVLELEFQLDAIDYARDNLVHADMSPAEFAQSMKDRGETFLSLFFRLMMDAMSVGSKQAGARAPNDMELLVALVAKDRAVRLKRILADQFENMESQISSLSGPQGSTLITERNKKALEVLQRQLQGGKSRVAIFYGAGHLSDLERRLEQDFGLRKAHQQWLTAWSIDRRPSPAAQPRENGALEPAGAGSH